VNEQMKEKETGTEWGNSQTSYYEFINLVGEKVMTGFQKEEFKKRWDHVCKMMGFEKEELKPDADQYFLLNTEGGKIGTLGGQ
jgi:hypothetical protein